MICNASKIEAMEMKAKSTGAIYLIIMTYNFLLLNFGAEDSTSSIISFGFTINPTKTQVKIATTGIKILLEIKSKISSMLLSPIETPLQIPNPREDGIPINMV